MSPTCPKCHYSWGRKWEAFLAGLADAFTGLEPPIRELVEEFLRLAYEARKTGLHERKARGLLDEFRQMYSADQAAFYHSLETTINNEAFNWRGQNLIGYVKAVFKAGTLQGLPPNSTAAKLRPAWITANDVFQARRRIAYFADSREHWDQLTGSFFSDWRFPNLAYRTTIRLGCWGFWATSVIDDGELRRRILARAIDLSQKGVC